MPYENEEPPFIEPDPELNKLTGTIIGAAITVHKAFGPGLEEVIYEAALCAELRHQNIPYVRQLWFDVIYRDEVIGRKRIDLIVGDRVIVELKSVDQLHPIHRAQAQTYLKITGLKLCLIINFNSIILKDGIKRVIRP